MKQVQALLVLPRLRVQNANAISSPLTHGFPSITAFIGVMWALERKLVERNLPVRFHGVGVVCHKHQELTTPGFGRRFSLTRNPLDKTGATPAIVEEGRMHFEVTLVLALSELAEAELPMQLAQAESTILASWAKLASEVIGEMRIAGGSVLPAIPAPGRRVRPWIEILSEDPVKAASDFRKLGRQLLPGFALVSRDDLLAERLELLRAEHPDTTLLEAWLDASRFNSQVLLEADGSAGKPGQVRWGDPRRTKGSGWIVPIPVGYAALGDKHNPGEVRNVRDATVPAQFVESVYSLGAWVSPHRLASVDDLLWKPHQDEALGLFRCVNAFMSSPDSTDLDELPADF